MDGGLLAGAGVLTAVLLKGKAVFVTGGARGIGRGIAEALAEAGAYVGVGDLQLEAARETARLVESRGRRALAVALDVTDEASLDAAAEAMVATFGRLDGWVNNAGHPEARLRPSTRRPQTSTPRCASTRRRSFSAVSAPRAG